MHAGHIVGKPQSGINTTEISVLILRINCLSIGGPFNILEKHSGHKPSPCIPYATGASELGALRCGPSLLLSDLKTV